MLQRLLPHVDGFVPAWMQASGPEMVRRARTAILIAWLMGTMFGAVLVMRALAGEWISVLVDAGLIVSCFSGPFLLRWTGRYSLIVSVVLGAVFALLCWLGWSNPNPGLNAATMALAEIPLFAIILFGPRVGYLWSAACGTAVLCIGLSDFAVPFTPTEAERNAFNEYWAAVIMSLTLVSVGVFYERGKDDSLRRIRQLESQRRDSELAAVRAEGDAKLQQAERFASLGRLAAAVAHEINNPLSYVKGNLIYAKRQTTATNADEVRQALKEALDGVERIRVIVDDLRGLTRPPENEAPQADVGRAVHSAVAIAEAHTRSKAVIRIDIDSACYVSCYEPRLSQAVLNLLINSAQALAEGHKDDHVIVVRARRVDENVQIEVEDDGPGIPPEILERVREPLFTTKPVGEGTGLGLALAEGIVRSYGGQLQIQSRAGRTVVTLTLPAVSPDAVRPAPKRDPSESPTPIHQVPLRILVCDDEPMVARAIQRNLTIHDVHIVTGGRHALARLEEDEDFDLVLCDLMMPEVSGMDVYQAIAENRPHLVHRLVFMSGGTFTEQARAFRDKPGLKFLEKPISVEDLKSEVKVAMDRVAAEARRRFG